MSFLCQRSLYFRFVNRQAAELLTSAVVPRELHGPSCLSQLEQMKTHASRSTSGRVETKSIWSPNVMKKCGKTKKIPSKMPALLLLPSLPVFTDLCPTNMWEGVEQRWPELWWWEATAEETRGWADGEEFSGFISGEFSLLRLIYRLNYETPGESELLEEEKSSLILPAMTERRGIIYWSHIQPWGKIWPRDLKGQLTSMQY